MSDISDDRIELTRQIGDLAGVARPISLATFTVLNVLVAARLIGIEAELAVAVKDWLRRVGY